jgi:hypothetical protein
MPPAFRLMTSGAENGDWTRDLQFGKLKNKYTVSLAIIVFCQCMISIL